jgi:hypothetical protein
MSDSVHVRYLSVVIVNSKLDSLMLNINIFSFNTAFPFPDMMKLVPKTFCPAIVKTSFRLSLL